jgi:hypothetical protein
LYGSKDSIGKPVLAIFFFSWFFPHATEVIGIHALLVLYDGFYYAGYF